MTYSKHAKLVSTLLISTSILIGCTSGDDGAVKGNPSATATAVDISRRIERLASDEFEGRAPATPGGKAASQYIADEMAAAGLSPMGENGTFFQPVQLTSARVNPNTSTLSIGQNGADVVDGSTTENVVFWTKRLEKNISVTDSELVFVGYGVNAPEYGWNDYAGLDVKGKTVVMLVNDPGFATKDDALFKGNAMTYYGRWTYKYEEAARQGAEAVLVIHETKPASYGWDVVSGSWTGDQYDLVRPDRGASRAAIEGWITYAQAEQMFAKVGLNLAKMKSDAALKGFKPIPAPDLKLSATLNQTIKTTTSRNVAGVLKGKTTPDEYVLYMAHWDHLGIRENTEGDDKIFNGAVDNATGTASIIEVAETMVERGAPDRSVIFVAVTAEESGLLGSAYYGEKPLVPLAQTVGGINIDAMLPVGETKDMKVIGFGASELEDLLKRQLEKRGMYIVPDDKPENGYFYRSDHISLAKLGVPMLYADPGNNHVTNGMTYGEKFAQDYTDKRYHKAADEYDNSWDLSGIVQATNIMLDMGYDLANSDQWPNWYEGTEFRGLRDEMLKGK